MVDVVPVSPREIARSAGLDVDLPAFALAGFDNGVPVGVGGLAWGAGRCWLFFHMMSTDARYAFKVRHAARRLLRHAVQLGETEVYTPRDASFPTSERLLKLVGFQFFGMENEIEVWRWLHSR